jgi:tRNA A37 threonylcarbamoyladenosine synthetase subunit TsaC/SUA5/YrdC
VGVRIPDHRVAHALVEALGEPIVSSTLLLPGEDHALAEGWQVQQALDDQLEVIIDSGEVGTEPTSVVDLSGAFPEIRREGAGDLSMLE